MIFKFFLWVLNSTFYVILIVVLSYSLISYVSQISMQFENFKVVQKPIHSNLTWRFMEKFTFKIKQKLFYPRPPPPLQSHAHNCSFSQSTNILINRVMDLLVRAQKYACTGRPNFYTFLEKVQNSSHRPFYTNYKRLLHQLT